jgi:hypothetical protein
MMIPTLPYVPRTISTTAAVIVPTIRMPLPSPRTAPFGANLPTSEARRPETVAVAVQLLPHIYPVGQQPPPLLAAQVDHPVAHAPVKIGFAVRPLEVVAITVTLFLSIKVVVALVGHEVGAQSRPNLQQPPW